MMLMYNIYCDVQEMIVYISMSLIKNSPESIIHRLGDPVPASVGNAVCAKRWSFLSDLRFHLRCSIGGSEEERRCQQFGRLGHPRNHDVVSSFWRKGSRWFIETRIIRAQLKFQFDGTKNSAFKPGIPHEGHVSCTRTTNLVEHSD